MDAVRIDAASLTAFVAELLSAAGVAAGPARTTADSIVDADLRELPSHGVLRLPIYLVRIGKGLISAASEWTLVSDGPSFAVMDAQFALGPVSGQAAMSIACEKARETGIALCLIRNASHFGAAGYYTRQAANAGFIGIALSNSAPMLSLPGSNGPAIGNNPISIAFPGSKPVVADLALSAGALGRVIVARNAGRPIPADWALDAEGRPTTDAAIAAETMRLQPIGGVKGFALGLAFEALTGVLAGSDFGTRLGSIYKDFSRPQSLGQLMIAIDAAKLIGADDFESRMHDLAGILKVTGNLDQMPGERSDRAKALNEKRGIAVPPQVVRELADHARSLGVALPAEFQGAYA